MTHRQVVLEIPEKVLLAEKTDEVSFSDLPAASNSSLDFWDNPFDDEDWNNA